MKEEKKQTYAEFETPLRQEIVNVKFIPKQGKITDPRHVLSGGMAEGATRTYTVPKMANGKLKNPLTDNEKKFLENYMGLEDNALSIYRDYWENFFVRVPKSGLRLDLSDPNDYIKYKVLLLNNNRIAPSVQDLSNHRASYEFVLASDNADVQVAKTKMQLKADCYKWVGKNEEDYDMLKTVIEILDNRKISPNSSMSFLQVQIGDLIERDSEKFMKVVNNPMINTQVLINKAITSGVVIKQGNFFYLRDENKKFPLCEDGEDPDLKTACAYLNNPKNQQVKFSIEAKL